MPAHIVVADDDAAERSDLAELGLGETSSEGVTELVEDVPFRQQVLSLLRGVITDNLPNYEIGIYGSRRREPPRRSDSSARAAS